MVYEQEQIKEIAEEVKRFMLENRLAEDFIKHISGNHNKGKPVPKMEEFVDNGCLRYELICFLSYRLSIMKDTEQKDRGSLLVEDLEMISDRTQRIERNEMEQTAWDVADLLKDVDYFKFGSGKKTLYGFENSRKTGSAGRLSSQIYRYSVYGENTEGGC